MPKVKIVNADVIEWAKNYRGEKFHAAFMDAPYELNFMGKNWDSSGIAFNLDTWAALAEHLLPGAFLFVFAGTLNDDLISVAMRQAGLRKFHKACLWWSYGSGSPKSSRIDSKIDLALNAKRKIIGHNQNARPNSGRTGGIMGDARGAVFNVDLTAPATPLAKTWAGHRYGLQAIKPAAETILIFQKPYDGKPVDSIVKNGAGALNIDGCRIGTESIIINGGGKKWRSNGTRIEYVDPINESRVGRWPANLILQHSHDDNGACSPSCPCRELDEQSIEGGIHGAGKYTEPKWNGKSKTQTYGKYGGEKVGGARFGDTGGASRFFYQADWNHEAAEQISNAAAVRYVAKAANTEREKGLIGNIACLICNDFNTEHHIVCKDKKYHISMAGRDGIPTVNEIKTMWKNYKEISKSGRKKAKKPQWALVGCRQNNHPTVKPISLCKYLATLLLPPADYAPRRILVPFAGVMSEAIGAMLTGWEEVTAIEKEKEYCEIGRARVKYWQTHKEPIAKKTRPQKVSEPQVADLFPEYE